jgi:hypothetical protein
MDPMNTKSNQELLNGHAILHSWASHDWKYLHKRTSWTKAQVRAEHSRLVKIMLKRGMSHSSPIY